MKSSNMKSPIRSILIYIGVAIGGIILLITLPGCTDTCNTTTTFVTYQPVYASMTALRSEVGILPPQERTGQGKIYVYGDYLLLGDPDKGIHVYDNSDQTNPQAISFINIPGNKDMAVRNNRLYADSYVDLLVFDISDPTNTALIKREENVFPAYNREFGFDASTDQVITHFEEMEQVEISTDCADRSGGGLFIMEDVVFVPMAADAVNIAAGPGNTIGVGGSMARFTIVDSALYAVDDIMMHVFSLADADNPLLANTVDIGWGIETIYPFKNNLFVGSTSGMFIYNIDNPLQPTYMSEVQHIRSCDPVVANDTYAFVTLRSENGNLVCGESFSNQLDVIDVTDVMNARWLKSYDMLSPYGLGLDGNYLFVTEGDFGLKVFDITDVNKIDQHMLHHITGFNAYDVIPLNGTLILTGLDGLYQFDYTNIDEIKMLSLIPAASAL